MNIYHLLNNNCNWPVVDLQKVDTTFALAFITIFFSSFSLVQCSIDIQHRTLFSRGQEESLGHHTAVGNLLLYSLIAKYRVQKERRWKNYNVQMMNLKAKKMHWRGDKEQLRCVWWTITTVIIKIKIFNHSTWPIFWIVTNAGGNLTTRIATILVRYSNMRVPSRAHAGFLNDPIVYIFVPEILYYIMNMHT